MKIKLKDILYKFISYEMKFYDKMAILEDKSILDKRIEKTYNNMISTIENVRSKPFYIKGNFHYGYTNKDIKTIEYENYLIYDVCGHSGDWTIEEFPTLKEVEERILSGGGILNMFTTSMIVMKDNKIMPYYITVEINGKTKIVYSPLFDSFDLKKDEFLDDKSLKVEWL